MRSVPRTLAVAIPLGVAAAGAHAVNLVPLTSTRTTSATVDASCLGPTSQDDAANQFDPFQSLSQSDQTCDGGATTVYAGAIQQSQFYPGGFHGWCVAHTSGSGVAGVEALAGSLVEIEFEIDDNARLLVDAIFERTGGLVGGTHGTVSIVEVGGPTLFSDERVADGGPYQSEWLTGGALVGPGTYHLLALAESGPGEAVTSLPAGEMGVTIFAGFYRIGDVNGDGVVDVNDLIDIITSWGPCPPEFNCLADLNLDGVVDVNDLVIAVTAWD